MCMKTIQGAKYRWQIPQHDDHTALQIASKYNIAIPLAHSILSRGMTTDAAIDAYLFSIYERDVAHPSLLKDADKAVDRILYAINNKQKILVFGDYDVDGITSSALMMLCLVPLGADINFFLPHRVHDGYGLSTKVVERAKQNKYDLIITVDNGITAFEPADKAKELGIDLIITDHHRQHATVPDAFAIINPNQDACPYPYKKLAGVGVIFKVLSLVYEKLGKELPAKVYELLLLGTVADVVPLTGENRFWVRHGLTQVNKTESYALKVLKQNAKVIKPLLSSTDIGFSITPQINALGRLEDPRQGVKFLIGADKKETEYVGAVLLELNEARKEIERSIYNDVVKKIESKEIDVDNENIILAASNNWPPGVIGLVASRLVGTYGKPTLLFHLTKEGIAKGSCRSIPAFNMFDALQANKNLLKTFGGHSAAAGLALPIDNLSKLKQNLEQLIAEQLTPDDLVMRLVLDAQAHLADLSKKLLTDMQFMQPFGHENPEPLFYIPNVVMVQQPQLLKDLHVKCSVFADGVIKPVLFFNRPELYKQLQAHGTQPFAIAARVSENHWNGRVNIDLLGIDVAGI